MFRFADDLLPEVTKKFSHQTAAVGEPVKFGLEFSGKPKRVQWFHKGSEVFPDGKYQVLYVFVMTSFNCSSGNSHTLV